MEPVLLRALVVALVIAVVVLAGRWWQRRDGAVREIAAPAGPRASGGPRLSASELGALELELDGADAGAVLLGSPSCAPCETVRGVLARISAERAGFRWVYADAADHLDLVTAHRVLRVPTLLVVAPDGRVLARTSGVPRVEELRAVVERGAAYQGSAAS